MKKALVLCVSLFFSPVLAFAEPQNCAFKKTQDILDCALQNHPEVVQSKASLERDLALKKIARQRPNPELESKIISGNEAGTSVLTTETSLLHTLELGGKRKFRIREALAQGELAQASLLESQELTALNTVLALYRLRQIRSELAYIKESLTTFDRILRQFKSRPLLPPEQAVSLSVFDLAKQEYQLREKSLLEEEQGLETFLEVATGTSFSKIAGFLPEQKRSWPKISLAVDEKNAVVTSGSEIKKAEADLKKAEAGLKLAKSNAWPDFKLGPTVETGTLGHKDSVAVGGSVAIPLPLLNLNRGEKAYAALEKARAFSSLEHTRKKVSSERIKQVKRYQNAVQVLSRVHFQDLNQKHHEVERFFDKGLVPSSLVIESHRQLLEITKSFHEQELTAIDSLWRVYVIDGEIFERKL